MAKFTKGVSSALIGGLCLFALFSADSFASDMVKANETYKVNEEGHHTGAQSTVMDKKTQLDVALLHLSARLSISPDEITVVRHENVVWPSSAHGCPEPEMMYAQAEVPGTRIILQVGKQTFYYHASLSGAPFHCPTHRLQNSRTGLSDS